MELELKVYKKSEILSVAIPVVGFVFLTAIASRVVIPLWFTPVPITMQVFAVILSGLVLGSKKAAAAQLAFITLILMGVPLTAYGLAGPIAFASPTAGYLLAFVPAAYVVGLIAESKAGFIRQAMAGIAGIAVVYICGTAWLSVYIGDIARAVQAGVVPFVAIDFIKAATAVILAKGAKSALGNK